MSLSESSFSSIGDDITRYIIQFLGLSHMVALKKTCRRFLWMVTEHPLYRDYMTATNIDHHPPIEWMKNMPPELKNLWMLESGSIALWYQKHQEDHWNRQIHRVIRPMKIRTITEDTIVPLCERANDRVWLIEYLDQLCTDEHIQSKFFTIPLQYEISTIRDLLEEKRSTWSEMYGRIEHRSIIGHKRSLWYEMHRRLDYPRLLKDEKELIKRFCPSIFDMATTYGLIGSVLSGKKELAYLYLSYGAHRETALFAASYVGNISLIKELLPMTLCDLSQDDRCRVMFHLFKGALIGNHLDLVKSIVEHMIADNIQIYANLWLNAQISLKSESRNFLLQMGCRSMEIVHYLWKQGILTNWILTEWVILTGHYEYLSSIPFVVNWDEHAQNIYTRYIEYPAAHLYCLKKGARVKGYDIFFDNDVIESIYEEGLNYLVEEREETTWTELFLCACNRLFVQAARYCLDKISFPTLESRWNMLTMGVEKMDAVQSEYHDSFRRMAMDEFLSDEMEKIQKSIKWE